MLIQNLKNMNYTLEIDIDLPLSRTVELMDNPDNLMHWMQGLKSYEFISGEPGKEGSKMKLTFQRGKKGTMEMIETITKNDLPNEMNATYEMPGVLNIQGNKFQDIGDNKTRWISYCEFQFEGWGMKLMAFLMPGAFKKQSFKFMQMFKEFAENAE